MHNYLGSQVNFHSKKKNQNSFIISFVERTACATLSINFVVLKSGNINSPSHTWIFLIIHFYSFYLSTSPLCCLFSLPFLRLNHRTSDTKTFTWTRVVAWPARLLTTITLHTLFGLILPYGEFDGGTNTNARTRLPFFSLSFHLSVCLSFSINLLYYDFWRCSTYSISFLFDFVTAFYWYILHAAPSAKQFSAFQVFISLRFCFSRFRIHLLFCEWMNECL